MFYTIQEKYDLIKGEVVKTDSKNPLEIILFLMNKDFVDMHGPEHHFLDGASVLVAYKNAGGRIDLDNALNKLAERSIKMPGAMCGHWGICGSVASIGAVLSIINETGPLTENDFYKHNMEFTSKVIGIMSEIGGPRCCKRNAFISILNAVKFIKEKYGIEMELKEAKCEFSDRNRQCLKGGCPFYSSSENIEPIE